MTSQRANGSRSLRRGVTLRKRWRNSETRGELVVALTKMVSRVEELPLILTREESSMMVTTMMKTRTKMVCLMISMKRKITISQATMAVLVVRNSKERIATCLNR